MTDKTYPERGPIPLWRIRAGFVLGILFNLTASLCLAYWIVTRVDDLLVSVPLTIIVGLLFGYYSGKDLAIYRLTRKAAILNNELCAKLDQIEAEDEASDGGL